MYIRFLYFLLYQSRRKTYATLLRTFNILTAQDNVRFRLKVHKESTMPHAEPPNVAEVSDGKTSDISISSHHVTYLHLFIQYRHPVDRSE